jgi:hypothetical protein
MVGYELLDLTCDLLFGYRNAKYCLCPSGTGWGMRAVRQLESNRRPCVSWSRTRGRASAGVEPEALHQLESNRRPCVSWSGTGGLASAGVEPEGHRPPTAPCPIPVWHGRYMRFCLDASRWWCSMMASTHAWHRQSNSNHRIAITQQSSGNHLATTWQPLGNHLLITYSNRMAIT